MAYGDPTVNIATAKQSAFGVPATSFDMFYRAVSISNIAGMPSRDEIDTINLGLFSDAAKPGKWDTSFSFTWIMTAEEYARELASALGAVSTSTLVAATAFKHVATPSATAANTRYYTWQIEKNGRVYTRMDVQPLTVGVSASDKFLVGNMTCGARWISSAQFIPSATIGPATYNGVIYTVGRHNGTDAAALTYDVRCSTSGTVGDGTAALETKLSTDGTWATARPVYANRPFELRDKNDASSGIFMMFTNSGVNDAISNAGPDTWTVSTRGTVSTGTLDTTQPLTWNSEEFSLLQYNSVDFTPKAFDLTYETGRATDDEVGGSRVVASHRQGDHGSVSGKFDVRITDAQYLQDSWNGTQRSFQTRAEGPLLGGGYYQRIDIDVPQCVPNPMSEDATQRFIDTQSVPFTGEPSTPSLSDAITITIYNSQSTLV